MTVSLLATVGKAKGLSPQTEEESEELKRFRQEWLEELHNRKATNSPPTTDAVPNSASPYDEQNRLKPPDHPVVRNGKIEEEASMSPVLRKALNVYQRAIEQEQAGNFDEALLLYRQAFKLVRHPSF